MTDKTPVARDPLLELGPPDEKFPRSAANFADALIEIQRKHFEAELANISAPEQNEVPAGLPRQAHILAESPLFAGAGWSGLYGKSPAPFRWMGRLGSLIVRLDLQAGAKITIRGAKWQKRRYLGGLTVWIDDMPVEGEVSRARLGRTWTFTGEIPALAQRRFHVLRVQTNGQTAPRHEGEPGRSLAVSGIEIKSPGA